MCEQGVDAMREMVVTIFNDSAAMEGNEGAFEAALNAFEERVRKDVLDKLNIDPHNG